jgi:hypothetical protein
MVFFASALPAERLLTFYRARALGAGYSAAEHRRDGDYVLAGSNPQNGTSYYLIVTPRAGNSDVALITNQDA